MLIAGVSSSGKSFCSQNLKNYLENKGLRARVISADDYYKGISKMVVEKAIKNNKFDTELNSVLITDIVRKVTENFTFPNKFCDENMLKIRKNLENLYDTKTATNLVLKIKDEFDRKNFDEPFAIDFDTLGKDLNELLLPNGFINKQNYLFITGEPFATDEKICTKDFDVFIVEGLYALRPELLNKLNEQNLVKCGINCDVKSLFARKLNRDIREGRSSLTQEQIILSFLTQILPGYKNFIQSTLPQAQFLLETSITKNEIERREKTSQIKFKITKEQYEKIRNSGLPLLSANKETDYYFSENNSLSKSIEVRLRGVGNEATKLSFRSRNGQGPVLERNVDEYDLSSILSKENNNLTTIKENLQNCGFELSNIINKYCETYKANDIDFKLDYVDIIGFFIEFDTLFNVNTASIIRQFNIKDISHDSYLDIARKTATKKSETELKLLVDKLPEQCKNPRKYVQTYFNPHRHRDLLCHLFRLESLEGIDSARIREENNGEKICLTLKTKGTIERKEYEREVSKSFANHLLNNNTISSVEKNRYKIYQNGYCFEFDEYKNELKNLKQLK